MTFAVGFLLICPRAARLFRLKKIVLPKKLLFYSERYSADGRRSLCLFL